MKQPNILIFMPDQYRADCLSCAGHPVVKTPNIDQLATEGIRFSRAYTTISLCLPARSSFFTGLYPHNHGCWGNRGCHLNPELKNFLHYLKKAGYHTCHIGKAHLYPLYRKELKLEGLTVNHLDDAKPYMQSLGWDDILETTGSRSGVWFGGPDSILSDHWREVGLLETYTEDAQKRKEVGKGANALDTWPSPMPKGEHIDDFVGRLAVDYLSNLSRQNKLTRRHFLQTFGSFTVYTYLEGFSEFKATQKNSSMKGSVKMDNNIKYTVIAKSGPDNPRNDTASVVELKDGRLMAVWHRYASGPKGGGDLGICRIFSKISHDGGLSWEEERMLVDVLAGDLNVQAPALCMLPSGELLLICLRVHSGSSTSMILFRSQDDGKTFVESNTIWDHSEGQWLQGGASSLVRLTNGRLLLPFHGGSGHQHKQHNVVKCFLSDDNGYTWKLAKGDVDLPMRGAMEASVAELDSGKLAMSLRTQLGSVFLSYSEDKGETWSLAQASGLKAPESCTCLRRIPDTNDLLLLWNDSLYDPKHHHYGERSPLSAAVSQDGGMTWRRAGNIEDKGDFEYTNLDCTFVSSGKAIITYMAVSPPFRRTGIDLRTAIIDKEWFYSKSK